jgi:polysaccharide export outer membrane protein
MKLGFNKLTGLVLPLGIILFCSCGSTKNVVYFPSVKDGAIASTTPFPESVIQKNDILSITVSSLNAEASAIFNSPQASGSAPSAGGTPSGYLVNSEGNIQFPVLGTIKAEGLTKNQLKDQISSSLVTKKLLLDPIVSIRFANFRVTVLGEVGHPTVVNVPNEKISLLEALGMAGDLTIYAQRKNVMIIREEQEKKIIKRLDLNSAEIFTSPYYYLQTNDIVYVEPNKSKVASTSRGAQWVPIILSALSLAVITVSTFMNN